MTESAYSRYAEHSTRDQINALLHYGHPIPVGHGLTAAYVAEHFPGWTWNELIAVWNAAGIRVTQPGGMSRCDDLVTAIHFNGPDDFTVQWADETTSTR